MNNIGYIDSAGLGTLIEAHLNTKSQGASLKLCQLGSKLQEVLRMTRLATVFLMCNTEAVAVASFSS
jgi:anti-anti-sigma factor